MLPVWTRVGQWLCGVRGHEAVLHVERERMWLECVNCGHATPGWTIPSRLGGVRRRPARAWPARAAA